MRDKYREMSDRINAIKPGMALRIAAYEIRDLPGLPDWAFMANITMGFDRVKESVIGSAIPGLWTFHQELSGDMTVYRNPNEEVDPYVGAQWTLEELDRIRPDDPLPINRLDRKGR